MLADVQMNCVQRMKFLAFMIKWYVPQVYMSFQILGFFVLYIDP